jgi:AcrR family transcriptional regulator
MDFDISYNIHMITKKKRAYRSVARQRHAGDTRERIADAAYQLLLEKRYEGMTIDAIAQRAEVSPQTVYAVFRSKAGILAELLDRTSFGAGYQDLVRRAREKEFPPDRLRFAARIARHIFDSQTETIDLLQGVSLVTPELADLIKERECHRYDSQKSMVDFISQSGWLSPSTNPGKARDILWAFTSRELYAMLVRQRGWSPQEYEDWLGNVLVSELLIRPKSSAPDSPKRKAKTKGASK